MVSSKFVTAKGHGEEVALDFSPSGVTCDTVGKGGCQIL